MSKRASGLVLIHAAPSHMLRQIGWSISRTLRYEAIVDWAHQPVLAAHHCSQINWQGTEELGPALTSMLAGWKQIHFEVIAEDDDGNPTSRWLYTPSLGIRHMNLDSAGNYLVGEDQLRSTLQAAKPYELAGAIENLLAQPWEAALEPFRAGTQEASSYLLTRAG